MIRPIDIKLNAAHPELPLVEATTFTGAPSSVFIRGVPKNCGNWSITAVNVSVTYPDNTTTTRAAVESAEGVWVATIPGTATSGRTTAGFRILADGIDENGAAVTGYVLGFADFSVLSFTPVPAPGGTFWLLRYFDTMPTTPKKGDVAVVGGVLKYYNGTAWQPFGIDDYSQLSNKPSINDVTLSGNKTAADLGLASKADATLTERGFSAWVWEGTPPTYEGKEVVLRLEDYPFAPDDIGKCWVAFTVDGEQCSASGDPGTRDDDNTLSTVTIYINDGYHTATRTALSGYQLGSQTDKPLASEAEAEALRTGKLDKSGGTMTGTLDFGDFSPTVNKISLFDPTPDKTFYSGSSIITNGPAGPNGSPRYVYIRDLQNKSGTFAFLEDIAPAFSTSATYALKAMCVHEGVLYRCTTAITTAEEWTPAHWTVATVEDVLAALRTGKQDALSQTQLDNIAAVPNKANASDIPYTLGAPIVIDTASSETVEGETVYYGAATLADRTANIVQVTAATALDELRITFPAATSGKVRDFGLRVEIGTGSAALAAPALVPIAPTGETIKIENADRTIPELADGTATAKGVTLLYFSENAPGVFVVKGEQVEEVA